MKKVDIWAHRGASAYAPENTLEAFQMAADMQADGVELDVQLTKDGKIVVIHDETINRVSDGCGYVRDFTLDELKNYHFNKTHPEFENATIPTLREVLQLLKPTNLKINIELKTGVFFYEEIEQKVLDLVKQYEMEDRIWYSSFNHYSVKKVKELCPNAKVGLLYCDGIYEPVSYAKALGAEALHPAVYNLQYPQYVEKCREEGIKIHAWTVNSFQDMAKGVQSGLDVLITNYPDKAKAFATPIETDVKCHFLFENPFISQPNRKFYLLGAGYQGKQFLKKFGSIYRPEKVLDNSEMKWGTTIEGIKIASLEILKPGDCVVISSMYFVEMIKQLQKLGVSDYYVFDDSLDFYVKAVTK